MVTCPESPDVVLPLLKTTLPLAPAVVETPLATVTLPLVVGDVPLLSTMLPLRPLRAAPVAIVIKPDDPLLTVPDENTSAPLSPDDRAFALRITTAPDDAEIPEPLDTDTSPPTLADDVVAPAVITTEPPLPLFVEPTRTEMPPARPDVALPLPTIT
jgi:hypothetical protein